MVICSLESFVLKELEMKKYNSLKYLNKYFILNLFKRNIFFSLMHLSDELRDDYDIVKYFVNLNGIEIKYASDRLKDDNTIVLDAIKNHSSSIHYANPRFKEDFNTIKQAILYNSYALCNASDDLRNNEYF